MHNSHCHSAMSIIVLNKTDSVLKGKIFMQDCAEKWSGP